MLRAYVARTAPCGPRSWPSPRSRAGAAALPASGTTLPENRDYRYDYYRDNCSTRVRDALDRVLGGDPRADWGGPTGTTYRSHTRRLTTEDLPLYTGLEDGLGEPVDRPIDEWEESSSRCSCGSTSGASRLLDGKGGRACRW